MKNIYEKKYENDFFLKLSENRRIKVMADILKKINLKSKNVLDIGCYDGTFLSMVKRHNDCNIFGVEASNFGVSESAKKGINVKRFFFDDKSKFPYSDGLFDLVIAGEIIEHIYDTDFFLDEISRLLIPNGRLLISTPNVASLGRRVMLFFGFNPIIELSPNEKDSSGHIRYFTFKTLAILLEKHGFEIEIKKSDVVNLSRKKKLFFLSNIFPTVGQSVIFLCKKK